MLRTLKIVKAIENIVDITMENKGIAGSLVFFIALFILIVTAIF